MDNNKVIGMVIAYLFIITAISFIFGCAQPQIVTKTEYVQTPSFCKVKFPTKPKIDSTTIDNIVDYETFANNLRGMLIYTDELEMALLCCTNSNDCITK